MNSSILLDFGLQLGQFAQGLLVEHFKPIDQIDQGRVEPVTFGVGFIKRIINTQVDNKKSTISNKPTLPISVKLKQLRFYAFDILAQLVLGLVLLVGQVRDVARLLVGVVAFLLVEKAAAGTFCAAFAKPSFFFFILIDVIVVVNKSIVKPFSTAFATCLRFHSRSCSLFLITELDVFNLATASV